MKLGQNMANKPKKKPPLLKEEKNVLFQLDQLLQQTAAIDTLYRAYLKRIASSFKARRVSLMLLDEARQELSIREAEGLRPEIKQDTRIKIGEGISGWVAAKGERLLVQDISRSRLFSGQKKPSGFRSGAFACIPIKLHGKVYGVLNVSEKKDGSSFTIGEVKALELFGLQLAVLVENQSLRSEIEWLEKKPVEEIAQVSHDFRIPLVCVEEALSLMEREEFGPVTKEQQQFLDLAKRNVKRLITTFEDLLNIATRVKRKEVAVTAVDLKALLEELRHDFEVVAKRKQVRLEIEAPQEKTAVETDRAKLHEVLMNLVDNAVKHTKENTAVQLRVKAFGQYVRLEVEDRGPGIDEQQKAIIFNKAASMKRSRESGNPNSHGLGLAICRDIVSRLGGRIGFRSQKGQGTVFYVELPKEFSSSPAQKQE